jgi:hypothetical protein
LIEDKKWRAVEMARARRLREDGWGKSRLLAVWR